MESENWTCIIRLVQQQYFYPLSPLPSPGIAFFAKPVLLWWHSYLISFSTVACSSASRLSSLVSPSEQAGMPNHFVLWEWTQSPCLKPFLLKAPTTRPSSYLESLICLKYVRKESHTHWAPTAIGHDTWLGEWQLNLWTLVGSILIDCLKLYLSETFMLTFFSFYPQNLFWR